MLVLLYLCSFCAVKWFDPLKKCHKPFGQEFRNVLKMNVWQCVTMGVWQWMCDNICVTIYVWQWVTLTVGDTDNGWHWQWVCDNEFVTMGVWQWVTLTMGDSDNGCVTMNVWQWVCGFVSSSSRISRAESKVQGRRSVSSHCSSSSLWYNSLRSFQLWWL